MSEKFAPPVRAGSLAAVVVPAVRFRTTVSFPPPVSPGTRLVAVVMAVKATTRPSAEIDERSVVPSAWTPAVLRAASTVVPSARSRTTMSEVAALASPGNRLVAAPDPNETRLPS